MDKTILITLPCTLGELYSSVKSAIENDKMDKCEICTCGYDGCGDAIFITHDYSSSKLYSDKEAHMNVGDNLRKAYNG